MKLVRVVFALLVAVAVGLVLSGFFAGAGEEPAVDDVADDRPIAVDGDYRLWPYTSRSRSVEGRTLAVNVVFHADAQTTRAAIEGDPEANWEGTEPGEAATAADSEDAEAFVGRDWRDAHSSLHYSYVEGPTGGTWLTETLELHDGAYLWVRDHLRAYESPDGEYTAIQAHEEYYDWFRLRHTVPGIDAPALRLESEFVESDRATDVRREYRGIDGGRSDGWLSVIEPAATAALVGAVLRWRTREAATDLVRRLRTDAGRHAAAATLGLAPGAVPVSVRVAGVTLETVLPAVSPKAIAAPLYLVLAALGVVAIGRATADRPVAVVGLAAWAVGLALPLADVI
ncbi:hypothetical protein EKH57_11730 [Halorubrum sp. BOL3-1]|uniref:hypothetical protein n=1 Tax=Halorubrum sp. BOL3-1 TaxID=2497325 RepID=UPI001004ED40|nr:hypothetical protein [Halorubrum sp. BOL3-1]QAU13333.1 hypothetical protein EKH57_11730 [Halorubrum sp. BOL3-1]